MRGWRRLEALRGLRWRLTLSYVGLLAILLTGLGIYQHVTLRGELINTRVDGLNDDLKSGEALFRAARVNRSTNSVSQLASLIGTASGHTVSVVVYDLGGRKLAQNPAGIDIPQLDPATLNRIAAGGHPEPEVHQGVDGAQLTTGYRVDLPGRGLHVVSQLSTPMAPLDGVLDHELRLILGGSVVALMVAVVIGLLLTGGALRPLRRLTVTAGALAGGDLRARSRLVPRVDEVGKLTAAFDNMADRIEEAFTAQRESEARVRRFIADASHELRTPVTALKGYIDVMRRGAARDPEALDAALEAMARESERMRLLILDLLTLARIDSRGQQSPEDFNLGEAVDHLLDEGVPGMPARLERRFPKAAVIVHCDRSALSTAVRNVLVNACKYAPGAPQEWTIGVDGARARIDAHDEGPGIPAADLPHVFERFYRGEKTRSREEGGSGLGLAIVQGLVRAQGGAVDVHSVEGRGTTVTLWLPMAAAPAAAPRVDTAA